MGRPKRADDGGLIYHVLNRANARMTIFEKDADYEAFERVLREAVDRTRTRLLAYCVMPNHSHLIVWPQHDGELSRFVGWLTLTHTQRWHSHRHSRGSGHLYQGRFKSFPVHGDEHFFIACRYVERNTLRATWSSGLSSGVGQACIVAGCRRPWTNRGWRIGRWSGPDAGCRWSTVWRPKPNWRTCVARSGAGVRLERRHGRMKWCVGSDFRPLFGPTGDLKSRERTPDTLSASKFAHRSPPTASTSRSSRRQSILVTRAAAARF